MKPDDPLYNKHNIDRIAGAAFSAQERAQHLAELSEALSHPDETKEIQVGIIGSDHSHLINRLLAHLHVTRSLGFSKPERNSASSVRKIAIAKLFKPHEVTSADTHPGVQFATSLIALDMYKKTYGDVNSQADTEAIGQFVLFKFGHIDEDLSVNNLQLGVNCKFGAIIEDGNIKPFVLEMQSGEWEVARVERSDPTEESGKSVDARVVQNSPDRLNINMLDEDTDFETYNAILDELRTFVDSRTTGSQT